jgi:hypothetical protein
MRHIHQSVALTSSPAGASGNIATTPAVDTAKSERFLVLPPVMIAVVQARVVAGALCLGQIIGGLTLQNSAMKAASPAGAIPALIWSI